MNSPAQQPRHFLALLDLAPAELIVATLGELIPSFIADAA